MSAYTRHKKKLLVRRLLRRGACAGCKFSALCFTGMARPVSCCYCGLVRIYESDPDPVRMVKLLGSLDKLRSLACPRAEPRFVCDQDTCVRKHAAAKAARKAARQRELEALRKIKEQAPTGKRRVPKLWGAKSMRPKRR